VRHQEGEQRAQLAQVVLRARTAQGVGWGGVGWGGAGAGACLAARACVARGRRREARPLQGLGWCKLKQALHRASPAPGPAQPAPAAACL
jgi:hypothetical protein